MTILEQDAQKFADFIQKHYPDAQSWKDPVGYCAWYISHFFIGAVCDEEGEIVAIAAARPVERPGMGVLPAYYNEEGTCVHVDVLVDISPDSRAIVALSRICQMRFPLCKTVTMFRRFESNIRVFPADKFWRNLEKIRRIKKKKETADNGRSKARHTEVPQSI